MRKLFIVAALCTGTFTVANAQYSPEKGDFAVELGFTPFNTTDGETFKLNEGMLKARYFLNDKNALRLKIGLGIDNKKETTTTSRDPLDKSVNYSTWEEVKTKSNNHTDFSFMLGYERHLFTEGRFDVYAGLDLGYGMSKYSGSVSEDDNTYSYDSNGKFAGHDYYNKNTDYINSDIDGENTSSRYFAGNLFAGVDVYVWKNLYLGAECGLAFNTGKSPNIYKNENDYEARYNADYTLTYSESRIVDGETNTTTVTTVNRGKTTTNTTKGTATSNETTETSFKFFVEPAIRIGWKF